MESIGTVRTEKNHTYKIIEIYSFLLLTHTYKTIKKSKFQPHRFNFQSKVFRYPPSVYYLYCLKVIYYSNCFNTPNSKNLKNSQTVLKSLF